MNVIFTRPQLTSDFKREIALARHTDAAVQTTANPAVAWVDQHGAEKLLFQALSKAVTPRPVGNSDGPVNLWLFPNPLGATHHVGIIFGLDAKGQPQCLASNAIVEPSKATDSAAPKLLFEAFAKARSGAAQIKLIQDAVNSALADQAEHVEKAIAEGLRYRTSVVFLIVLTPDKPLTFVTTLVITGPQTQARPELRFTGMVKT